MRVGMVLDSWWLDGGSFEHTQPTGCNGSSCADGCGSMTSGSDQSLGSSVQFAPRRDRCDLSRKGQWENFTLR